MNTIHKKISSIALILSLCFVQFVLAQETELPSVSEVSASVVNTETLPEPTPEVVVPVEPPQEAPLPPAESGTEVVQGAVTTQEAVNGDVLENTANPEIVLEPEASTTVSIEPEATSTDVVVDQDSTNPPSDESVVVESNEPTIVAEVTETPVVTPETQTVETQSVSIAVAELVPEPEFAFALTGDKIPTKKKVEGKNGKFTEEIVATPLTTTVDNEKGEVRISGSCSDVYFVVLLSKHEEDYRNDPASYIVNRAYECANNTFSYAISELPSSLPNGTYYLLVGEQGEKGAWKPVTELTEITINKN